MHRKLISYFVGLTLSLMAMAATAVTPMRVQRSTWVFGNARSGSIYGPDSRGVVQDVDAQSVQRSAEAEGITALPISPIATPDNRASPLHKTFADYAVRPEEFGAAGDGVTDDRTQINAAASYVCNRGYGTLLLQHQYAVWDDVRTSDPANNHAYDGLHIVLGCGGGLPMRVQMLSGSALLMRGLKGANPSTSWQTVYSSTYSANAVWRGSGIFIEGGITAAAASGQVTIQCLGQPLSCLIDGGSGASTANYTFRPASAPATDGISLRERLRRAGGVTAIAG